MRFSRNVLIKSLICSFFSAWIYAQDSLKIATPKTQKLDEVLLSIPSPYSLYNTYKGFGTLTWSGEEGETSEWQTLQDVLQQVPSVHLNNSTGNPLSVDVQIRGFQASSLLGTPVGVAVYSDGVRRNDLLGSIVYWDMMPTYSMKSLEVYAGSQPLFGLNALGGTINYRTKTGFDSPGSKVTVNGGSFGRIHTVAEYGKILDKKWAIYLGGSFFSEEGWRRHSPSKQITAIAKISKKTNKGELHLSTQYGNSDFIGNGALPLDLLDNNSRRNEVYTYPDNNNNTMIYNVFRWQHQLSTNTKSTFTSFVTLMDNKTLNGDESPFEDDDDDDDNEERAAVNNRNNSKQLIWGGSYALETSFNFNKFSRLLLQYGIDTRAGNVDYESSIELATFNDNRQAIGTGVYIKNGVYESVGPVGLKTSSADVTAFAGTQYRSKKWKINTSVSFNYNNINLKDLLGEELNGNHDFSGASAGLKTNFDVNSSITISAGISTSQRNPSAVELGCADKNSPCRLPNAFLADPPLNSVRSLNIEGGFLLKKRSFNWTINYFNTTLFDDIYFISAGPTRGAGYFDNIGTTRRWGIENSLSTSLLRNKLGITFHFTYQQPTFETSFVVFSPNHPDATNEEITISKGNYIPMIPQVVSKWAINYRISKRWDIEFEQVYNSKQYVRGDENNTQTPLDDYLVSYLKTNYNLGKHLEFNLKASNLFDVKYETFGLFGEVDEASELLGTNLKNPIFATPAYPLTIIGGMVFKF